MRTLLESGRPIQTRPFRAGFGVRPVPVLGQLWNPPGGGGVPSQIQTAPAGGAPSGFGATPPAGSGFTNPGSHAPGSGFCGTLNPSECSQPLAINITAFRADNLKGAAGIKVKVALLAYDRISGAVSGAPQPVLEGTTDENGKFLANVVAPEPSGWFGFRVTISSGGGISFSEKSQDVQGFQANNAQKADVSFAVCPSGIDDLVCEVGERQVVFTSIYNQQVAAWGQGSSHAQGSAVANFAFSTAYYYVHQMKPRNTLLAKYWEELSYAVCDVAIPPTDWPALLANYVQVQKVFDAIPWPPDGKTEEEEAAKPKAEALSTIDAAIRKLFRNCARGLPIYNGKAIADPRLFAPTFSDYFPREDYKIRGDMGSAYLLNIHMIFQCMVEELQKEAEALRRYLSRLSIFRLIAAFIFAPLTGGAMLTTLITETGQYVASQYQANTTVSNVNGVIAGVSRNVGVGASAIGAGLFAVGASLLLPLLVQGADPTVQKIAELFGPRVAEAAARDVLDNVIGSGTVAGQGLMSAAGLGTAGATLAVEAMLSFISLQGLQKAQDFIKTVNGVKDFINECATPDPGGHLCAQIAPFVLWCIEAMMLDKFFDYVAGQAGISGVDVNSQALVPAAQAAEAQGVTVPSSAITPGAAPSNVVGSLAAVAGIGAGGFLALLLTGAFAR